jgi:Leucine-rich repeat (LRR) protein
VPVWLSENQHLEMLDLGYNKIVAFPDFSKAVSLTEVDVQSNFLSILPWSLLELPNLKVIYIKDNPFLLEESAAVRLGDLIEERRKDGLTVVF